MRKLAKGDGIGIHWMRMAGFLLAAWLVLATCLPGSTVRAQEGDAPAQAPPAGATTDSANAAQGPEKVSMLKWTWEALTYYTFIFLGLSFALVALFVMNVLQARRETVMPTELIEGFEAHLNAKQFQEAYELASTDESFLGKLLSAGLGKVSKGYEHAIEAMQEVGEDESMKLEHRLSYIALIGTISPMVGLFGTVDGMIRSFSVIATSPVTPSPSELAKGISTALLTTLVGLAIAIPAIAAYGILRNRIDRLVLEVGMTGESLMSRFQTGKKPSAT